MKFTIILSLCLIISSELQAEEIQLYGCMDPEIETIIYTCKSNSSLHEHYSSFFWNCTEQSGLMKQFKCDGNHFKRFILHMDVFGGDTQLKIISFPFLEIGEIHTNGEQFVANSVHTFNASYNQLTSIPSSISMPNLESIDFFKNKFTSITLDELMGASGVKHLNLSLNQIISVESAVFSKFSQLESLNLSRNRILHLAVNQPLNKLNILNLSHNRLSFLADLVNNMPNVTDVDLSANQIKWIALTVKSKLIRKLKLSYNRIDYVAREAFSNLLQLEHLDLSHNKIKTDHLECMQNHEYLKYLNLSHNLLVSIPETAFDGDESLTEINLSNNLISDIGSGVFSKLEYLQRLDLSKNLLKTFGANTCNELTHLFLEGNGLTSIENVSPGNFSNLKVLSLARNKLTCEYLDRFFEQWEGNGLKLVKNEIEIPAEVDYTECRHEVTTPSTLKKASTMNIDRVIDTTESTPTATTLKPTATTLKPTKATPLQPK